MQLKILGSYFLDDGLKRGLKETGRYIKEESSLFASPGFAVATAVGTYYAMSKAIQAVSDAYNLSYDSALKNTKANVEAYNNTKSEIQKLSSQSEEYKTTLTSLSDKYNIELTGLESIDNIIQKLHSVDKLEVIDQNEIDKIEYANSALGNQILIKEKLATSQQKKAAEDAKDSFSRGKQSVAQQVAQFIPGGKLKYQGWVNNVNTVTAIQEDIRSIRDYEKAVDDLEKSMTSMDPKSKEWKNAEKDISSYNKAIKKLNEDLKSKEGDLSTLLSALSVNGEGLKALEGYEKEFKEAKSTFDQLNNVNLSQSNRQIKQIESYFNGSKVSNNLKDQLLKAVKSGKSATDALHEMGITLNDLGITGEGRKAIFDDYFSGLVESAEEAQQAINSIDGSVDGVKAAFESENKDADWNSMSEYLKQAEEIYKETSKVGTDDFKATVQFISPDIINPDAEGFKYDADAYVAAWENAREKVKRYFDSENPITSATNFTNDLIDKGLASKAGDDITWGFENSAEAAKALEISVEATEVAMRNLESYGAEFDDVMLSGEGLKRYENALNGIKSLRDSMEEGESKKKLSGLIGNWDSELAGYQNDLSTLTEDQIVKIEFQYDLASIRSEIEELQNEIDSTGGDTKEWGSLNSKKRTLRDKLASQDEMSGATDDSGYQKSLEKLDGLSQKLKSEHKELGEDGRREIQLQQSAILDLQSAYLEAFSSGQAVNWEEFLGSKQIDDVVKKISQSTGLTKDEIGDLVDINWESLSKPIHLKVDGEFQAGEIESKINELSAGSTITFRADVSGVESEVQVLKNEDGTLTYTANVDGVQTQVLPMLNQDGTVDYILGESPEEVPNAEGEADFTLGKHPETAPPIEGKANYSGVFPAHAPSLQGVVTYRADFSMVNSGGGVANKIVNIGKSIGGGKANGTLLPAHANGTGYNVINYRPAYSDGKISLSQDEEALVNELGIQNAPMCTHRKSI